MNEKERLNEFLTKLKFKKKLFGVSELDVWMKLELLQQEYEKLFELQAEKYEAIIQNLKKEKEDE